MRKYRYHYYTVEIPPDFSEDKEERANQAILEARERARLYVMPCSWRILSDNGFRVRVGRVSNRPVKTKLTPQNVCPKCGKKRIEEQGQDGQIHGYCSDCGWSDEK